jgi:hypothetical protein
LKENFGPEIAYDEANGVLVVTYDSLGGMCPDGTQKVETRWYTSHGTPLGASWNFSSVTGCQTSIQPTVVFAGAGVFHTMSSYVFSSDSQHRLSQVDWRSANGGLNWSGVQITPPRSTPEPINAQCYWGDYTSSFSTTFTGVFYSWGQLDPSTSLWDVQGAYVSP